MKKILMISTLMLSALLVYLHADTRKDSRAGHQSATVVSLDTMFPNQITLAAAQLMPL